MKEFKHGTGGYRNKCRCEICKEAKSLYNQSYRATPAGKQNHLAGSARYNATEKGRESQYRWQRNYLSKPANRVKRNARNVIKNNITSGKITPMPCDTCGENLKVEAHHPDYNQPLYVVWLCHKHHLEVHNNSWRK